MISCNTSFNDIEHCGEHPIYNITHNRTFTSMVYCNNSQLAIISIFVVFNIFKGWWRRKAKCQFPGSWTCFDLGIFANLLHSWKTQNFCSIWLLVAAHSRCINAKMFCIGPVTSWDNFKRVIHEIPPRALLS